MVFPKFLPPFWGTQNIAKIKKYRTYNAFYRVSFQHGGIDFFNDEIFSILYTQTPAPSPLEESPNTVKPFSGKLTP